MSSRAQERRKETTGGRGLERGVWEGRVRVMKKVGCLEQGGIRWGRLDH